MLGLQLDLLYCVDLTRNFVSCPVDYTIGAFINDVQVFELLYGAASLKQRYSLPLALNVVIELLDTHFNHILGTLKLLKLSFQ